MKKCWLISLYILSSISYAQLDSDSEKYSMPVPIEIKRPFYPSSPLRKGEEGWVDVNFMVDTDGHVFDPVVVNSFGHNFFKSEAISAIKKSTFKPAVLNGDEIISSFGVRFRFYIKQGSPSASANFENRHKRFNNKIENGSREEIQVLLDRLLSMGSRNYYENAYLNWAQYRFALRFGTPYEQLAFLWDAIDKGIDGINYLSDDILKFARREIFRLEVFNGRLSEAVATYKLLEEEGDVDALEMFKPVYEEILKLKDNDSNYSINATIEESGNWFVGLYKHKFNIDQINGKIDELKFRCSKKYIALVFDPELDYIIPDSWGECGLNVIGDAGATFVLTQY